MYNKIVFKKGQKFKLLFQKEIYKITKVSGKCIFTENEECGIIGFHYNYLVNKVRFLNK
jgi:hypothetical protein